jgi:hypothetical protein
MGGKRALDSVMKRWINLLGRNIHDRWDEDMEPDACHF